MASEETKKGATAKSSGLNGRASQGEALSTKSDQPSSAETFGLTASDHDDGMIKQLR
jgi:hypothetical protein